MEPMAPARSAAFDDWADQYDAVVNRAIAVSGEDRSYFARERVRWLAARLAEMGTAAGTVLFSDARTDWSGYDPRPWRRSEFAVGVRFIQLNGEKSFRYYTLGRWACIPFSLLGGLVCFLWAGALYGRAAGLAALALWCFCPNVLGHGQLLTPDVAAAALGAAAGYAFWRWLRSPAWTGAVAAGLLLGLAELTKSTWIVVFLLWPVLWAVWNRPLRRTLAAGRWRGQSLQLATALAIGLYVLNAGYGFEGTLRPLGDYEFVSHALGGEAPSSGGDAAGRNRFAGSWLGAVPVPLPSSYLHGIDITKKEFEQKKWSYLRGQWRFGGWWYYYLYGLAVKVPLGTWLLGLAALALSIRRRAYSATWRDEATLLAPAIVVLALVSSQTGFSHHLRYVLPAFPFAFIGIAKVARSIALRDRMTAVLGAGAIAWTTASCLAVYPHSLSYFNELAGGPAGGAAHLDYSNIDWGQDLIYLKEWLAAHPEAEPLGLAYSIEAFVSPRIAGIEYSLPPIGPEYRGADAPRDPAALGPRPGWYAISVNALVDGRQRYAYFRRFRPAAMVGFSIYVYHIAPEEAEADRREMGLPRAAP